MAVQQQQNFIGVKTFNGEWPRSGPRVIAAACDFSIKSAYTIHMDAIQAEDKLEGVQGIFLDNTANGYAVTALCRSTQQTLTWPAGSFGYLSFFGNNPAHIEFQSPGSSAIVIPLLCSFPLANFLQQAGSNGSTGIDYSANKPALLGNLLATIPANPARNYFEYQNQSGNLHQVVMDDGAGNNISISLINAGGAGTPGGSYTNSFEKGRIRIYSSAAGDQFYLRQN